MTVNLRVMSEYKPGLSANTRTTVMSYNGADRLTNEAVYDGTSTAPASLVSSTAYGYDPAGNRTSKSVAGGLTTTYVPNDLNQLTSFTDTAGRSVSYGYDGNGNRATRTENGHTDLYGYDLENRLTRACHELKASVLNKLLSKRLVKASQCSPARVAGRRS